MEVSEYNVVVSNKKNGETKLIKKIKNQGKQSHEDNTEKIHSLQKKYYDQNRDVIFEKQINYEKKELTRI